MTSAGDRDITGRHLSWWTFAAARCGLGPWWPGQQDNLQQNNPKRRHSFHDPFHDGDGQRSNYIV